MIFSKAFRFFDWPLFLAVLLLALTGIMMIYSTGIASEIESKLWVRQVITLLLGIFGLFFFSSIDYRYFNKIAGAVYLVAIFLLVAVFIFGQEIRGAVRWYDFGFFNFQPAEFSKLALIFLLARFFQKKQPVLKKFRYVLWSGFYLAVAVALLMLQPDLGSAIIHATIWAGMLFVSATPRRFLFYVLVIFLILSVFAWMFLLHDYQKDRIRSFTDPTTDPSGAGYNAIQSIVAVGSGGVFGTGLARGLQSQLRFLPERQTDFIFASTVEELGFIGGGIILLLFILLLQRLLKIIRDGRELFGVYLTSGIFFLFLSQILINIGMNLGLVPVTGVTLPLMSYGGSSLMITFWLIGIVQSVYRLTNSAKFV
ncbi:MAG: rod shape-determining protein RodA [bacterium]|nr:rod shape-determining protein RodA [bacterium]